MKLFKIRRNQIIISALVVMVAVAGYLTYIDRPVVDPFGPDHEVLTLTPGGEITALIFDDTLGTQIPVVNITGGIVWDENGNAVAVSGGQNRDEGRDPGAAVFVNSTNDSSYFLQAKLNREQSRSNQKQLLTDLINNTHIEREQRAESAAALLVIQNRIEMEAATEALIESKGFREVYVRIGDDTVDVVVNKSALTQQEVAQIEDIVRRKTGYAVEQIYISPLVMGN
jgi:stage III sporulation protein AH